MKVFQGNTNEWKGVAILIVLLAFSLVQHPVALASAESSVDYVWATTHTIYHSSTGGNTVSCDHTLTGDVDAIGELQNSDDWMSSGDVVLAPKLTFTTTLPVSRVSEQYFVGHTDNRYEWVFPDFPECDDVIAGEVYFDPTLVSASYTLGFTIRRSVTPAVLDFPGGQQTLTVEVTPTEPAVGAKLREWIQVWVNPCATTTIIFMSAEVGDLDEFENGRVRWWLSGDTVGTTYTFEVTYEVYLGEGDGEVHYVPQVAAGSSFGEPKADVIGNAVTMEDEVGTWRWEADSEHTWGNRIYLHKWIEMKCHLCPLPLKATLDIDPDTLSLKSKVKFITCYIELPEDYSVEDILVKSVALTRINDASLTQPLHTVGPSEIGDHDNDGIPDLMVKFDRQELIRLLTVGHAELTVAGQLVDGPTFEGTETIRVIGEGKK